MSKKDRYAILIAIALMTSAMTLQGCSSSGNTTADLGQQSVAKGVVTVSATFPNAGGAVKSLIPTATKAIYVKFNLVGNQQQTQTFYDLKLTAATPTGTIKLAPGNYYVYAMAYDSDIESNGYPSGNMLAQTSTGGVVNLGSNTVNLTFLNGVWTVVDASGKPTPIELSNGSQLKDMVIGGDMYQGTYLKKAAFDFSKPMGGGGGLLRYRFNNYTSARVYGNMMSQFIGATNSIEVSTDSYNLTQKCSDYYNYADNTSSCEEKNGDQIVMINGGYDGSYSSGGSYEGEFIYGSGYELLPNKGQTTFTQNGVAIDLMSKLGTSTIDGGSTISGTLVEWLVNNSNKTIVTTPSPAKLTTAKVVKAQSSNTPYTGITVTDYNLMVCATKSNPNSGTWNFNGKQEIIGTATCYRDAYLQNYNPTNGQPITPDAGDFSYNIAPTDLNNLGDYCHQWDYNQYLQYDPITNPTGTTPNPNYNTCKQQKPGSGEIYLPYNFRAKKTATKTAIDYGSFKANLYVKKTTSGTAYVYPFIAKGKAN